MTAPQCGTKAPDFTLSDVHGTPIRLAAHTHRAVLLVFFPFAFSGICTAELRELDEHTEQFDNAGVRIIAISCDSVFTLKAWAHHEGYEIDLLSDFWPHGAVARTYGVFDEENGLAVRGSFLIDATGIVRWSVINGRSERRDMSGYHEALAQLPA